LVSIVRQAPRCYNRCHVKNLVGLALAVGWTVLALPAPAAEAAGLRPRADHTRYPVAMFNEYVAVAVERVAPEKVRRLLGPEVDEAYLVVEVSIYPRKGASIDIAPGDFYLRVSRTREIIPASMPAPSAAVSRLLVLPEAVTNKPVAGYLYFPVAAERSGNYEYELEYKGHGNWMIIPIQAGLSQVSANPRAKIEAK